MSQSITMEIEIPSVEAAIEAVQQMIKENALGLGDANIVHKDDAGFNRAKNLYHYTDPQKVPNIQYVIEGTGSTFKGGNWYKKGFTIDITPEGKVEISFEVGQNLKETDPGYQEAMAEVNKIKTAIENQLRGRVAANQLPDIFQNARSIDKIDGDWSDGSVLFKIKVPREVGRKAKEQVRDQVGGQGQLPPAPGGGGGTPFGGGL